MSSTDVLAGTPAAGRPTTPGRLARVVVVDDHEFFRDGLVRGLGHSGYLQVVGEAGTGREAIDLIRRERPDVAVVDYQMPDLDGLDVVHAVVRDGLDTRVVILSAVDDGAVVFRALEAGARGYLSKDARRGDVIDAVRRVSRGETVVPAALAAGLARQIRQQARDAGRGAQRPGARGPRGLRPGPLDPAARRRAVPRREHGQDPHPAPLREARRLRPGGGGGRGHAARAGRVRRPRLGPVPVPATSSHEVTDVLVDHFYRGARVQRTLRLLLVAYFALVLFWQAPTENRLLCWGAVACYAMWAAVIGGLVRTGGPRLMSLVWTSMFVDVLATGSVALLADGSAGQTWTAYLIVNGFFLVPVIAAAQLDPWACAVTVPPAVGVYLLVSVATRVADTEPWSAVLLRTGLLAAVGVGCVLLTRLQRARVQTIAGLVSERSRLLEDLVEIEDRERSQLAESLHDGALQYVLAARMDLEDVTTPVSEAAATAAGARVDHALSEAGRLLRSTLAQLHPAVVREAGLPAALRDVVATTEARGRLQVELVVDGWPDDLRTTVDELLLTSARELLGNVVRHARAATALVELRLRDGVAMLAVEDDGTGMAGTDTDAKLREGHLGLASRRIRIEAAGGRVSFLPVHPHGTRVLLEVPVIRPSGCSRGPACTATPAGSPG